MAPMSCHCAANVIGNCSRDSHVITTCKPLLVTECENLDRARYPSFHVVYGTESRELDSSLNEGHSFPLGKKHIGGTRWLKPD